MAFGHSHDLLLVIADRGGAHTGVLASVVAIGGFVCLFAWVAWRFGPTLMRFCGLASWWAGWACGSQGGYGYMIFFLILGSASWGTGTIWYHARRGRWPSLLSQRLFTRLLGEHRAQSGAATLTPPPLGALSSPARRGSENRHTLARPAGRPQGPGSARP